MKSNQKRTDIIIICLLCSVFVITIFSIIFLLYSSQQTNSSVKESNNSYTSESTTTAFTAQTFVDTIQVGWNLGNALDSCVDTGRNDGSKSTSYYETAWGSPVITSEMIQTVADAGFSSIRIPVTWYYNTYVSENGNLCIQTAWLERVKEVVDYAIDQNLYVILDSHHDAPIIWADIDDIEEVSSNVSSLWSDIATYFKDYDEHLLFESFNEINTKNNDWTFNQGAAKATNTLNQVFVDAVRNAGGNNEERLLVCSTYLNETSAEVFDSFVLPDDNIPGRLLVDVHSYNSTYNQNIDNTFSKIKDFSEHIGVPVIIGEFGTTKDFVPYEYRAEHASNYIARAQKYGLKCFWWDNSSSFRLFDRKTCEVVEPEIINHLMNPKEFETANVSTNTFNDIHQYAFGAVDPATGEIIESSEGTLTFNLGNLGFPLTSETGYRITLNHTDDAQGLRLCGLAFYDGHHNFISYTELKDCGDYDFTADSNTCYVRISMKNPWGYRSLSEYEDFFKSNQLSLEITEYKK